MKRKEKNREPFSKNSAVKNFLQKSCKITVFLEISEEGQKVQSRQKITVDIHKNVLYDTKNKSCYQDVLY